MTQVDLTGSKVISARHIETAGKNGATEVLLGAGTIVTPSARDIAGRYGLKLTVNGAGSAKPAGTQPAAAATSKGDSKWEALFRTPEAEAAKREICEVGKKLWLRAYVDGNGGNISILADYFFPSMSLIDATAPFGLPGTVQVTAPEVDLSGVLAELVGNFIDAAALLRPECGVRLSGSISSFIVMGRGGLPIVPGGFVPSGVPEIQHADK